MTTEKDDDIESELKTFFTDPKYKRDAEKLRLGVRHILAEIASEEEARQKEEEDKKPQSIFSGLFNLGNKK